MAIQNAINLTAAGIAYHDGNGVFSGNNLQAATNTISSTNTNGNVILAPDGTGGAVVTTDLTVGNATQDVSFTVNGSAISATVSVEGTNATDLGGIISHRHSDTAGFGGHFVNLRSRGSHASPTVVSDGDTLSIMASAGYDGTDYAQASQIITQVDGTPGANDMPGRMLFLTSADGGQTPTEAMRITSGQLVGINTTAPTDTLHVTGNMELDHTAAENDDHALEIVCDANGFTDVKALDIDYITGAIAAGEDEEAIIVNIDETASTGGIMAGYLVLTTTEGSATINGYETGIGVNPIVHQSGTFGDADNILNIAVDVTAALASGGAGAISIFVNDNDTVTIGDAATWDEMEIILATGASGAGVAPTFEYSTGGAGFSSFVPADGTNGFRNTGAILWDSSTLAGWATNASGRFEIRITRTRNTLATTPIIDELQISSTTEYKWDKDGALNVASLSLGSPLTVANGGTGLATITDGGVMLGSGTGAVTALAQATNGQLVVGSTGADPVLASLTAPAAGVTITGGAGTITFALADDLAAVEGLASAGLVSRTAADTWAATAVTDNAFILGDAGEVPQMLGPATTGQIPVGVTSGTPLLLDAWMQQGNNCWFWNLSFTHSAGTLTLAGADGTALSATNPGYVVMPSNATEGRMVLHSITANDTLTVSDLTGNTFGTTAAIAWGNDLPLYVGFMADSSDANLEPIISRLPHIGVSPASSANIGDPSAANADQEYSVFAWNDITEGNYQDMQVGLIGSLRATKAVTTDAWTLTALDAKDGVGRFNDNRMFEYPLNQNGAAAGTYIPANGGTAPIFTTNEYQYSISRDGLCTAQSLQSGDGGTDGAGAVVAFLTLPYRTDNTTGTNNMPIGGGTLNSVGTGNIGHTAAPRNNTTPHGIEIIDNQTGGSQLNSDWSNGGRFCYNAVNYRVATV